MGTIGTVALLLALGCAQRGGAVTSHPIVDHPVALTSAQVAGNDPALEALITQSRSELPEVRRRFTRGLEPGRVLYVTVRFFKPSRDFEQAFVEVRSWTDQGIHGVLASNLTMFDEPKAGDTVTASEEVVVDWTIVGPDEREEGNRVGHYAEGRAK